MTSLRIEWVARYGPMRNPFLFAGSSTQANPLRNKELEVGRCYFVFTAWLRGMKPFFFG
jgi:hypothetical protein